MALTWASSSSAQNAIGDFCYARERSAAIGAGTALEHAAKAVVAHRVGVRDVFVGRPTLDGPQLWVAGDHEARAGSPPASEFIATARRSLLELRSISAREAITSALPMVDGRSRADAQRAAWLVLEARNAAVHLGDVDTPIEELCDAFIVAIEAMWSLIPAAGGAWGVFTKIARVGVIGRDELSADAAIRLAHARDRFYSMGTIYVRRRNFVAGLSTVECPVCASAASYDQRCMDPAPEFIPRSADGSVALLDCVVCGLTLWGPQIVTSGLTTF